MQKARIRTGWKNKQKTISVETFANAVSAICWRLSLNAAKNLHEQDFVYENDAQRIAVIRAYLFFFIHCADRLTFTSLDQDDRQAFLTSLSLDCGRHYRQNHLEVLGTESKEISFIKDLNSANDKFSECSFTNGEPGFELYRGLGFNVQSTMGDSQTNKWVLDQVMHVDGPNAFDIFNKSFGKLQRSSGF